MVFNWTIDLDAEMKVLLVVDNWFLWKLVYSLMKSVYGMVNERRTSVSLKTYLHDYKAILKWFTNKDCTYIFGINVDFTEISLRIVMTSFSVKSIYSKVTKDNVDLTKFLRKNRGMEVKFCNFHNVDKPPDLAKLILSGILRRFRIWPPNWPQRLQIRAQEVFPNSNFNETMQTFLAILKKYWKESNQMY